MLDLILARFPPLTQPLTLVADPDGLLAIPEVGTALRERGFLLIDAPDPIALRVALDQARPFTVARPVIVWTAGPLNALPYDLWQAATSVIVSLAHFFSALDLATLRELPRAVWIRLAAVYPTEPPEGPGGLGPQFTRDYLLRVVWDLDLRRPITQARLLAWLADYHAGDLPLPPSWVPLVAARLAAQPALAGWPLTDLLADPTAYRTFVQAAWHRALHEPGAIYTPDAPLPFHIDPALQELVPRLVRSGAITPARLAPEEYVPDWARAAFIREDADNRPQQFAVGLAELEMALGTESQQWTEWQAIARQWAQLTWWRYDHPAALDPMALARYADLQARLDTLFVRWIQTEYTRLGGRRLPEPHHLHHVPHWLAAQRARQPTLRPALLILDGMALADWCAIRAIWMDRHPAWRLTERLVLAQVPSITAVSRQALVSGLRPDQFGATLTESAQEPRHWREFWAKQDPPVEGAVYERISPVENTDYPAALGSRRTQVVCLVTGAIDDMVHGATQGTAGLHAALRLWLDQARPAAQGGPWLEGLVQALLDAGYTVFLTSDHGHVEATGIGEPHEGVLAASRTRRARLYTSPDIVEQMQRAFPATWVWQDLLPTNTWALLPEGRGAFVQRGATVVTHGGVTLDELVVPLATITKA
jgi:hypothetical protein